MKLLLLFLLIILFSNSVEITDKCLDLNKMTLSCGEIRTDPNDPNRSIAEVEFYVKNGNMLKTFSNLCNNCQALKTLKYEVFLRHDYIFSYSNGGMIIYDKEKNESKNFIITEDCFVCILNLYK